MMGKPVAVRGETASSGYTLRRGTSGRSPCDGVNELEALGHGRVSEPRHRAPSREARNVHPGSPIIPVRLSTAHLSSGLVHRVTLPDSRRVRNPMSDV